MNGETKPLPPCGYCGTRGTVHTEQCAAKFNTMNENFKIPHEFQQTPVGYRYGKSREGECVCGCLRESSLHTMNETKKECCKFCYKDPQALTGTTKMDCAFCLCHTAPTPNNSLEGKEPAKEWRERLENEYNEKFGFGVWDSRAASGHRNEGISSSDILEFFKAFIERELATLEEQALARGRSELINSGEYIERQVVAKEVQMAYDEGKSARDAELREATTTLRNEADGYRMYSMPKEAEAAHHGYEKAIDDVLELLK